MNIDTYTLKSFLAIAETNSFTKAAQRVGRTQSALSQQIAKLESYLGTPLLKRDKSLSLTPSGEIFLGYAKQLYTLHQEVFQRFKEPELEGEIRFGIPEDFASVFLSDVLADFSRTHPRIHLNIECDLTLNLLRRFKEKEFDLVLVKMSRPEDFPNGMDVWSEPLVWVGQSHQKLHEEKTLSLVLSPQPCVYRSRAITALEKQGVPWRVAFSSRSYQGTIAAVKAGMGITILPKNMVPKGLEILSEASSLPPLHDTHISLLKHSSDHPALNSFESFVLKHVQ